MADLLIAAKTDIAKIWGAKAPVFGYAIKVTRFVVGSFGHDPSNPQIPLTPQPSRTGCYCGTDALSQADGCLFGDFIDSVEFQTPYCPVYNVRLESGEAVGVVSSICLIAEVTYSPIPGDPVVGTEFLYAIVNMPYNVKVPGEVKNYAIAVPTKL